MRALPLLLAMLLAGCSMPGPRPPQGDPTPAHVEGVCAQLALDSSTDSIVPPANVPLELRVTMRNCGSVALPREPGGSCGPGPRLTLAFAETTYDVELGHNGTVDAAAPEPRHVVCAITDAVALAPGETLRLAATWNGTLREPRCTRQVVGDTTSEDCWPTPHLASPGHWVADVSYSFSQNGTELSWHATLGLSVLPTPDGCSCQWEGVTKLDRFPVDLSNVSRFSAARTGDAPPSHESVDGTCDCGFMVFEPRERATCPPDQPACPLPPPAPLAVVSPFDATVVEIQPATMNRGAFLVLASAREPAISFWVLAQPVSGLRLGDYVATGDLVARGYPSATLGLEDDTSGPTLVDPWTKFLAPDAAASLASVGLQAEDLAYPRTGTTPHALSCDPTLGHAGPVSDDEWVYPKDVTAA